MRSVLITGASRGIGRAVARQFAVAGDQVAIHHRDSAKLAAELAADLTVLDLGRAGDQGDRFFFVLVILQAQRLPGVHVNDLANILAVLGGEDLLMAPGLLLPRRLVDLRLLVASH